MKIDSVLDAISTDIMFPFEADKKIGHLRCQFGEEKQIANQFIPTEGFEKALETYHIDKNGLNEVLNVLQFDWIQNYAHMKQLCQAPDDTTKEKDYFLQWNQVNYWIRLHLFGTEDYNCYIYCYHE